MTIPPLRPGLVPPFHELGPDVFEDLCRELVQEEGNVTGAERYGTHGQRQFGVDLLIDSTSVFNPNRKIFEARKRETAALGAGEKLVLGHPLAATIGDSG